MIVQTRRGVVAYKSSGIIYRQSFENMVPSHSRVQLRVTWRCKLDVEIRCVEGVRTLRIRARRRLTQASSKF